MQANPPGHPSSTYAFVSPARITSVADRLLGTTTATYDAGGHVATLTAPNGAAWAFTTDGLDNPQAEASPDRGAIVRTFDAAGNVLTATDARGITATFTYDALNRLTGVTYPAAGDDDVAYAYDTCAGGIGRLCAVTDPTGTRTFAYDGFGRPTAVTWTANGQTYTTAYSWTPGDRLASLTHPSGRVVTYTRDALGRITSVATGGQDIVSGRAYRADGLLTGQTFGNGLAEARTYDLQGRLTSWSTGTLPSRIYGRDPNGNVTAIGTDTYGYDALDRITTAPGLAFTWDANGNRLSDALGSYSYTAGSNRLTASPAGAVTLDSAGNTTALGAKTFTYDQAGRLATASISGAPAGQYRYSFDGHRAVKTAGGTTTLFHYGADGRLLAETDAAGNTLREYVWDDDGRPLAQFAGAVLTYLHADHLGSPRFGTDAAQALVWDWPEIPFGTGPPAGALTVELRHPGQYHDAETGLFQNWHRTYDPASGRYLESDPIGLAAGLDTYGYVDANPPRLRRSRGPQSHTPPRRAGPSSQRDRQR